MIVFHLTAAFLACLRSQRPRYFLDLMILGLLIILVFICYDYSCCSCYSYCSGCPSYLLFYY